MNTVTAKLSGRTMCRTAALYQYDYGQILLIDGIDLPVAYEVHFSNQPHDVSTTQIGGADGVRIPDIYLQSGLPVYAWIYLHTGEDDGETEYSITIPVIQRAKPTDQAPTPVQQDAITEAIAALNAAVETTGQDVTDADAARAAAENAQTAAENAQTAAENAQAGAESAQTGADQSALNAASSATEAETAHVLATSSQILAETAQGKAEAAQAAAEAAQEAAKTAQGKAEDAQEAIENMGVSATTLQPGSAATVQKTVDPETGEVNLTFGIPAGEDASPADLIDDTAGSGVTDKTWSANKLAGIDEDVSDLKSALNVLEPSASAGDVGKFLKAKNVADGKVTEYEFGSASGGSVDILIVNVSNDVMDKTWQEIHDAMQSKLVVVQEVLTSDRTYMNPVRDAYVNDNTYYVSLSASEYYDFAVYTTNSASGYPEHSDDANNLPVTDVQVNGTSILNNGVANVPIASSSNLGVVKSEGGYGIFVNSAYGRLYIDKATSNHIKAETDQFRPIVPYNQHESAFYGLAKAAGDTSQSASSNAVGTYTDSAKTAIQGMLNVADASAYGIVCPGTTAPQAIASGQYVIWQGKLYKATTAIAGGETLTSGTNVEAVADGGMNELLEKIQRMNRWELINTVTVSEDSTEIKCTTDSNGHAFRLRKIMATFSAGVSTTGVRDRFYTNAYGIIAGNDLSYVASPAIQYPTATSTIMCRYIGEANSPAPTAGTMVVATTTGSSQNVLSLMNTETVFALSGFRVYQQSGTSSLIPANATLTIYGIRDYDD